MATENQTRNPRIVRLFDPAAADSVESSKREITTDADYVSGEIDGVVITPLKAFTDHRGWLMEV
jgi:hypothetical protein